MLRDLGDPDPDPTVWLRRDREVLADGLRETFTLVNRSSVDIEVDLHLDVAADLAPIETIKSGTPGRTTGVVVHRDLPDDSDG